MQKEAKPELVRMILSGHDSVLLLPFWLRLCSATRSVSRPSGTYRGAGLVPNVETLGYCRVSLRDKDLALRIPEG